MLVCVFVLLPSLSCSFSLRMQPLSLALRPRIAALLFLSNHVLRTGRMSPLLLVRMRRQRIFGVIWRKRAE